MRAQATACAAALVIVTTLALAQNGTEGVRLDYQVDARCPGQDAFIAEVHSRSPRVKFSAEAARALVVRIEPHGPKLAGRIELGSTQRAVTGATCEEVLSALGLVTALALDPLTGTSAGATVDASTSTNTDTGTGTSTSTSASASAEAGANDATETDAGAPHEDDERDVPVEKRTWSFGAGADLEAVFGVAPDPLFAVPVFFEATRALSPHVALGGALRFARAGESAVTAGVGADFTWTAGALDLCVVLRSGRFRLNACERTSVGAIDAQGVGVIPARSATRPWADLGLALSLRARVVGPVFVEAAGHFGVALVQDRFFLEPDQTVFQASWLTADVGGGLGFEIW